MHSPDVPSGGGDVLRQHRHSIDVRRANRQRRESPHSAGHTEHHDDDADRVEKRGTPGGCSATRRQTGTRDASDKMLVVRTMSRCCCSWASPSSTRFGPLTDTHTRVMGTDRTNTVYTTDQGGNADPAGPGSVQRRSNHHGTRLATHPNHPQRHSQRKAIRSDSAEHGHW